MNRFSWYVVPIAVLGSAAIVAATLLHYIQSHRLGEPGGYGALALGAAGIGLLSGAGSFLAAAEPARSVSVAVAISLVGAVATAGLLLVTLVWAFGS